MVPYLLIELCLYKFIGRGRSGHSATLTLVPTPRAFHTVIVIVKTPKSAPLLPVEGHCYWACRQHGMGSMCTDRTSSLQGGRTKTIGRTTLKSPYTSQVCVRSSVYQNPASHLNINLLVPHPPPIPSQLQPFMLSLV
jgi:hypothetical protein